MYITILTFCSRGDVQPFLPLSVGLMRRGHVVKLASPRRFKELIEGYWIQFVPLAGELEDLSRKMNAAGFNTIKMVCEFMGHAIEIGVGILRQEKPVEMLISSFIPLPMLLARIRWHVK